ncbi:cysteinyl leukotriene receptor 1-like [Lineus longissimus]|uniref:cysteinyl leukotriene receptor 1-like n=1 Tax=Lineus longissimus TaxID=88925 RepID=UPI002B4C7AEC
MNHSQPNALKWRTTDEEQRQGKYPELEMVIVTLQKCICVYIPIGVVGNIISFLATASKDNRKISVCVYMSALSVVDTMVLLTQGAYLLLNFILSTESSTQEVQVASNVQQYIWYSNNTFGMLSGLFLAMMSTDRAIAIQFPFRAKSICTPLNAKKAIILVSFIPAALNINLFFTYRTQQDTLTGSITEVLDYPNPKWVETVVGLYILLFGTIFPFTVIIFCNTLIILNVQKASRRRQKMDAANKPGTTGEKENHLTRMLILVSLTYLILSIPLRLSTVVFKIPELAKMYDLTDDYWQLRLYLVKMVLFTLWTLNFAVNFYMYLLGGGQKFRNETKKVFAQACKRA